MNRNENITISFIITMVIITVFIILIAVLIVRILMMMIMMAVIMMVMKVMILFITINKKVSNTFKMIAAIRKTTRNMITNATQGK